MNKLFVFSMKSVVILMVLILSGNQPTTPRLDLVSANSLHKTKSSGETIVVTSTADSGPDTLRQALLDAQSGDTITFDPSVFPPAAPATIFLQADDFDSSLPNITQGGITIDASNAGVILDGRDIQGDHVNGLEIYSNGNTIRGLQIINFSGSGIALCGGSHNTIGGDRSIGIGPLGQGNLTSKNVIGIDLCSQEAFTSITGNLVGTDPTRSKEWGNRFCGICIEKCPIKIVDDVFEVGMGKRKAIYRPFPQAVPKYPVLDREHCTYFLKGKCKACELFCPTEPNSIDFEQEDEILKIEVGNIILATGYDLFDVKRIPQYGYGRLKNVFTSLEFERMVNASGPTDGKIVLRDGITSPKNVAIVHCVGSRDENYHEYCSKVCCMYSLKFAHLVHERIPNAEVYNCYIDMRTPGKGYEEFYRRLLEEDTNFIRGKVAEITDAARTDAEEGKLIVQVEDTLIGKQRRVPVDMVILSAGLEPRRGAQDVAHLFGLSRSADGFFLERHPKLGPVETASNGVFIAGACQSPKDIPDTVAQAGAAAAAAMVMMDRGRVTLEPSIAQADVRLCSGCGECVVACPYSALQLVEGLVEVDETLCKGCGVCVGHCRSKAITLLHFTDEQLLAEVQGALRVLEVA